MQCYVFIQILKISKINIDYRSFLSYNTLQKVTDGQFSNTGTEHAHGHR